MIADPKEQSGIQAIAVWLVARPINAALALGFTVSAGLFGILSGAVLVLLVLHKGPRKALLDVALALPIAVGIGLLYGMQLPASIIGALAYWLPAMLLGVSLFVTRSITLTLQLSVIYAIAGIGGLFLIVGNPVDYWIAQIDQIAAAFRAQGNGELADWFLTQKPYADQLTMVAVYASWFVHSAALVLGYKLYRALPGVTPVFGRFRDLNLGKVLAVSLLLAAVVWMLSDSILMLSIAAIVFGGFWLQGLAMVHWLYGAQMLPKAGVVVTYVLLLSVVLSAVTVTGLAVFGYLDAWFRVRRPKVTK